MAGAESRDAIPRRRSAREEMEPGPGSHARAEDGGSGRRRKRRSAAGLEEDRGRSPRRREGEVLISDKGHDPGRSSGDPVGGQPGKGRSSQRQGQDKGFGELEERRIRCVDFERKRKEGQGAQGEVEEEEESDPGTLIGGGESEVSEKWDERGEEALGVLRSWLRSEDLQELSVAQSGALVALLVHRSGTALGRYLSRTLVPEPAAGQRDGRQRSLLPLPLYEDSLAEIRTITESGEFRRLAGAAGAKKKSGDKAGRAMRRIGLLVWHGLSVLVLNQLWTGGGQGGRAPCGPPTKAQRMAQDRIWDQVKRFFDDTAEVKEKVVRAPAPATWEAKLKDFRISYQGEVVEKAHSLTLEQVLPGLPPAGYGGSVPLLELCEGEVRERLENPLGNLLPEEELPERLPRPR